MESLVNLTILKPCLVPTDAPVLAVDGASGGVTLVSTKIFPLILIAYILTSRLPEVGLQ